MFIFLAALISSILAVWAVLKLCRASDLTDKPDQRSSHSTPTPRGGGVGFVVVFLLFVLLLLLQGTVSSGFGLAVLGGGLAVAGVGFLDDCFQLSPWPRLAIHF